MYLTGGVLDRRAERYNILAASAFCMLVYEPLYLFDIGFQLSYLAVLSILYFQPRLQALIKVHNPFLRTPWGWVTVTLSAQAGTTFFMSVLFRAVFDCLFVDELAAYVSCDFVDTGKFGLHVFA